MPISLLPGLSSIWSGITDTTGALVAFFATLTDYTMWRSLGWLILGVILIAAGAGLWLKNEAIPSVRSSVGV